MSARWKIMDVVYQDTLHCPRCLILSVHTREDGTGSYEAVSESDGSPVLSDNCAMTKAEWLEWLSRFCEDLTGRQLRQCREAVEAELVEPKSWVGFRKRFEENGDPWLPAGTIACTQCGAAMPDDAYARTFRRCAKHADEEKGK